MANLVFYHSCALMLLHLCFPSSSAPACTARRCHTKYLVRCVWAGDGHHLATCSHDQTVQIHRVELEDAGDGGGGVQLCVVQRIEYTTSVQDVCFLCDGVSLVVALRDTNLLRVINLDHMQVCSYLQLTYS